MVNSPFMASVTGRSVPLFEDMNDYESLNQDVNPMCQENLK